MKTSLPRLLILCFVLFSQLTACQQWDDKMCDWFDECSDTPGIVIEVSEDTRSCEILVDNLPANIQVDSIEFTGAVEGFYLNRGTKVAMAFVATSDAFPAGAVKVTMVAGSPEDFTNHINTSASACFDNKGNQLTDKFWDFQ